jgi:hypothetical protein
MRIRDGKNSDPGWKTFGPGIRDKHPGSATLRLLLTVLRILGILRRRRIRGIRTLDYGSCSFRLWLSWCQQTILFFLRFLLITVLTVEHIHWPSKIISHKEVTKQLKSRFSFIFACDGRTDQIRDAPKTN